MEKKLGRPFKQGNKKIVRTYTVQPELYNKVNQKAANENVTVTSLIINAFKTYIA